MSNFTADAVPHYPVGGPVVGPEAIADRVLRAVEKFGCVWTVDSWSSG